MAFRICDLIRRVQPEGPYLLAGAGSAGILAYETALQLLGNDQQVDFLGLLDTPCGDGAASDHSGESWQHFAPPELAPGEDFPHAKSLQELFADSRRDYLLLPLEVATYIFAPSDCPRAQAHSREWAQRISPKWLRLISVPGTSATMWTPPHLTFIGRLLAQAVREARFASQAGSRASQRHLIALQTDPSHVSPLICVPGAGATVLSFADLVAQFGRGRAIYGIQPRGMDETGVPHSSVTAAASYYVRALSELRAQPSPHLLGHSYGGWVVYEMACQLRTLGRPVASVTLIDAAEPRLDRPDVRQRTHAEVVGQLVEVFEMIAERGLGLEVEELHRLPAREQIKMLHAALCSAGILPKHSDSKTILGPMHSFAAALRSNFASTHVLAGAVNFVTVEDPGLSGPENHVANQRLIQAWRTWAPTLDVFHSSGNHMSVLKPMHAAQVADWLRTKLAQNQGVHIQPHPKFGARTE